MKHFIYSIVLFLFTSCYFFGPSPKSRLAKRSQLDTIDVAIVPGLPLHHGIWDTLLKSRILWSEFLYRKGYVKHLIYSGNAVYTPWVESETMKLYAVKLGIKKEDVLIDTLAEHSTENLFYSYQLAISKGYKSIAVATDPFQCAMLHKFAKKSFNKSIILLPIVFDSIRQKMAVEITIDTVETKKTVFTPLAERQSYKDRLNGTRGKNINR
jgi:hypothetical protein